MAFPETLDDLSTTRADSDDDQLDSPNHLSHHEAEDAAIEALETKVGVNGSVDRTSLAWLLFGSVNINEEFLCQDFPYNWERSNGGGAGVKSPDIASSSPEQIGGSLIFETGTAGDATTLSQLRSSASARYNWEAPQSAIIEIRAKWDDMSACHWQLGFYKGSTEHAIFENDDGNLIVDYRGDGGSAPAVDTPGDTLVNDTYYIFRIETFADGSIKFYIDGDLKLTTDANVLNITTNNQKMCLFARVYGDDANNHKMWVSYIRAWQDRS